MRHHGQPHRIRVLIMVSLLTLGLLATGGGVATAAGSSDTPVMSPPTLTELEVLTWFKSRWRPEFRANATEEELIRIYRQEGGRMAIRWDAAFAQGIVETGWFNWPDSGMVRPSDNNYAGLGAYDGSGGDYVFRFPDARTGVLAQMQHLRLYSDPTTNLEGTNLGAPLAKDVEDRYPARWRTVRGIKLANGEYAYAGRVPRWEAFGNGMWATDPLYSCKVLNIYRQMLEFNGKNTDGLPTGPDCQRVWHLRFHNAGGAADALGYLGRDGDRVLACDWNGDGADTPATFRDGGWAISNRRDGGGTRVFFHYGRAGDLPLCGDWDGNGKDTVGIIRDGAWHLKKSLSGGSSDILFSYGRVTRGDVPIVGNWDGKGADGIGIVRDGAWHLRNSLSGGAGEITFFYGRRGDLPLVGDWNNNGRDGVGIVRGGEWHLRSSLSGGPAERTFVYGRVTAGDVPLTGDWNNNGTDTPAIVR